MSNPDLDVFTSLEYVSRGGQKLEKALEHFYISPADKVCIDCGASTGGFTDCLLKRGAKLVYAVDVGYGQLAWSLRTDKRVVTMERTNIRYVTPDMLEQKPELAVIDLSFISLALVLPVVHKLLVDPGEDDDPGTNPEVICLIKPQFEAGKGKVGKKGVVREPEIHKEVLDAFIKNSENAGFFVKGITYSPVKGPKGNIEYLGWLGKLKKTNEPENRTQIDTGKIVSESHNELV
jgi:23S rRNA (cytidine1920-2'-O)/16S rRNA (cytidine1409-2'-O)-methyltransferase